MLIDILFDYVSLGVMSLLSSGQLQGKKRMFQHLVNTANEQNDISNAYAAILMMSALFYENVNSARIRKCVSTRQIILAKGIHKTQ